MILNSYVTDMSAVETHILEAVERQLESDEIKQYPDAVRVITSLRDALKRHTMSLEAFNDKTEGGDLKETVKEALFGALGVAAGIYDNLRQKDPIANLNLFQRCLLGWHLSYPPWQVWWAIIVHLVKVQVERPTIATRLTLIPMVSIPARAHMLDHPIILFR